MVDWWVGVFIWNLEFILQIWTIERIVSKSGQREFWGFDDYGKDVFAEI